MSTITISCTNKVRERISKVRTFNDSKPEIDFYNWYVNQIILQRKKYWLFTHSQSLFSILLYAGTKNELKSIEERFEDKVSEMLIRMISTSEEYAQVLFPNEKDYVFSKTNSPSVLGSMNDFKFQIEYGVSERLSREQDIDDAITSVTQSINHCPMKYSHTKKYGFPDEEMKVLIEARIQKK